MIFIETELIRTYGISKNCKLNKLNWKFTTKWYDKNIFF